MLVIIYFYSLVTQKNNIKKLISEVETSQKELVEYDVKYFNDKISINPKNIFKNKESKELKVMGEPYHNQFATTETIIFDINFDGCSKENISFLLKYQTNGPENSLNFSKIININKKYYKNFIFFPVYRTIKDNNDKIAFEGYFDAIEFYKDDYKCLRNIFKLTNPNILSMNAFAYYGDKNDHITLQSINKEIYGNMNLNDIEIQKSINKNILKFKKPLKFFSHAKRSNDCNRNNCSYPNECFLNSKALQASREHEQICSINNDFYNKEKIFLKKNEKIYISGKIVNGKFKINILNEDNFYYGELINTNKKFKFLFMAPKDGFYKLIFSYKNNLYHYIENNIVIDQMIFGNI